MSEKTFEVVWTVGMSWSAKRIEKVKAKDEESAIASFKPDEMAGWKVRAFQAGEWNALSQRGKVKKMRSQRDSLDKRIKEISKVYGFTK